MGTLVVPTHVTVIAVHADASDPNYRVCTLSHVAGSPTALKFVLCSGLADLPN
jgi:hypothetical protein